MTFNPQFGICIPTYNRTTLLKRCIDSFFEDAIKFNVPIYISDNGSSNDVDELIKTYQQKYENLFFFKQSKNVGIDKNMMKVIDMAKTKYALWLGSDDTLRENAIETILNSLETNPDFCILKVEGFKLNTHYDNPFDLFYDFGMLGYDVNLHFSTLIVDVVKIQNLPMRERYNGTMHTYAGAILDYLMDIYNATGKINVTAIDKHILQLNPDPTAKSWKNSIMEVYAIHVPQWYSLLKNEYKENPKVISSYEKFLNLFETGRFIPYFDGNNFMPFGYDDIIFRTFARLKNLHLRCFLLENYLKIARVKNALKAFILCLQKEKMQLLRGIESVMTFAEYFKKVNAEQQIEKSAKKYKNKKIILYGTGKYFDELLNNYDLSKLNIIGICDLKFSKDKTTNSTPYKAYAPEELPNIDHDVILITAFQETVILNYLKNEIFKRKRINIKPLIETSRLDLIRFVFGN